MKNKKAQGLSMETIIVAIIVMVVLVILVLIFTGRMNIFSIGTNECSNNGGSCISTSVDCPGVDRPEFKCGDGKKCCIKVGT